MSASLLSDMESFKAANPNGKLEDFIRWYSPRDWIEEDNTKTDGNCYICEIQVAGDKQFIVELFAQIRTVTKIQTSKKKAG